jgi:hypothetical protein
LPHRRKSGDFRYKNSGAAFAGFSLSEEKPAMIRRKEQAPAGGTEWVLIGQADHARLSGALAEHWGAGQFAPLEPHCPVLEAVVHHDDGWPQWERCPKLDPTSGRPLDFLETPPDDAREIWSRSIAAAEQFGPLQAWLVASHFSALLRGSDHAEGEAARMWLRDYDRRREAWLAAWRAEDPAAHAPELPERGLRQLQLFDRLSLWFCCAPRSEPQSFSTPDGPELTIAPLDGSRFQLDPWPFRVESLALEVLGQVLPADDYRARWPGALAEARPRVYYWTLCAQ